MNCKPGDLAIIIDADPRTQMNIGRIVSVLELAPYVGQWRCAATGGLLVGLTESEEVRLVSVLAIYDNDLRPVSGLPIAEDETHELPYEEHA